MGAVVIYAMAKNARGNGGKRTPKTKVGLGSHDGPSPGWMRGRERERARHSETESEGERGRERERKDVRRARVSVRFRG